MIPKKIHYVWVGGNPKSKDIERCIKTWKKHLPDYEIIEWNENNFDINSNQYVKKAYEHKKWAFVSDYIRMYAIYNYGGIYFDTDVLVLDNLDEFLHNEAFIGYEDDNFPFTAVFGAVKGHSLIKHILEMYDNISFDKENVITNTEMVKKLLIEQYNCKLGNKEQLLKDNVKIYKKEILCKPSIKSKTIHAFNASWIDKKMLIINKIDKKFRIRLTNKFLVILYIVFEKIVIMPKNIIVKFIRRGKV